MTSREISKQFKSLVIIILILVHNEAEALDGPLGKMARSLFTQRNGVSGQKMMENSLPLHSVLSEDKIGLAQIAEDFEKNETTVAEKTLSLHRHQLYDIDIIVDNLFDLAVDTFKHPPSPDEFYEAIQKYNQSILSRVKTRISHSLGKVGDYANFVRRYHRWVVLHKRLEVLDKDISTYYLVAFQEFSRTITEVRVSLNIPISGSPLVEHLDYERELEKFEGRDILLEVLERTMGRLEQNLEYEDPGNLLGQRKRQPDDECLDEKCDRKLNSLKSLVLEHGSKLLVKGAKSMLRMAILRYLSTYVSDESFPYGSWLLFVGKLFGFLGIASVSSAVDALRDQRTRTALTLTDMFKPKSLNELLRKSIG